jgi:RimJ/RimL family protein N-acetyltransferase
VRAPRSRRLRAEIPEVGAHLDFAARQFADPEVAPWHWPAHLGGARTRDQTREIIEREAAQFAQTGFCLWWWRELESGALVGQAGLNRAEVEGEPVVEVGWSIAPDRWGEGLATEAGRASLDWGFDVVGLDRIVSFTLHDNLASRRVMEKLGMERVGEFERKALPHVLYQATAT